MFTRNELLLAQKARYNLGITLLFFIIKGQCKTTQSRALWLLVLVEVQQTYLVLQQVALRVVLEYRAGSGPLSLHVGDLLPVQAYVLLQQVLYLTPRAVREVGYGVRLVEDSASVLPVRRKVMLRCSGS